MSYPTALLPSLLTRFARSVRKGTPRYRVRLKLVDPNTHKRRKLREPRDAYQRALQAAFVAGCATQSAANDVVVEYDLSGYAKNALKKYVPQQ